MACTYCRAEVLVRPLTILRVRTLDALARSPLVHSGALDTVRVVRLQALRVAQAKVFAGAQLGVGKVLEVLNDGRHNVRALA